MEEFGNALLRSQQSSIDAFLEHRPEYIAIGKTAIALFILRAEQEKSLFDFDSREKGCYQYIFSKLSSKWDEFNHNAIGFVTFNYDRALEYFLFTSIRNTYNEALKNVQKLLKCFRSYMCMDRWENYHGNQKMVFLMGLYKKIRTAN